MHRTKFTLGIELTFLGLLGLAYAIPNVSGLVTALRIILGIILAIWGIVNISYFYTQISLHTSGSKITLIKAIVLIVFCLLMLIPYKNKTFFLLVTIVIFTYLAVFYVIRLIKASNKKEQVIKDIYQYIISFIILSLGLGKVGHYILYVIFGGMTIFGIILLIINHPSKHHDSNHKEITHDEVTGVTYDVEDK